MVSRPSARPSNPCFSSGPCAKRPGWRLSDLEGALLGRSHRSRAGRNKLLEVIETSRRLFEIPESYRIAIVGGSNTGALEMALWSLLGERPVEVLAWDSFGKDWAVDVLDQLKIADSRVLKSDHGKLPDLTQVSFEHDVVTVWNGTTGGVCLPDGDWIPDNRSGLVICDATSAVGAMHLPWDKLDVITYSWQKTLGGEAQHGMLVLSERAVARLSRHVPPWPIPKLFRLTDKNGQVGKALFQGDTINTPSLLCVEDVLDALSWAKQVGGLRGLIGRCRENFQVISQWVEESTWSDFLARDPQSRSPSSVCLETVDQRVRSGSVQEQDSKAQTLVKLVASILEEEGVALDIAGHRAAPPGFRIWAGPTVESSDLRALMPWLDWAFEQSINSL